MPKYFSLCANRFANPIIFVIFARLLNVFQGGFVETIDNNQPCFGTREATENRSDQQISSFLVNNNNNCCCALYTVLPIRLCVCVYWARACNDEEVDFFCLSRNSWRDKSRKNQADGHNFVVCIFFNYLGSPAGEKSGADQGRRETAALESLFDFFAPATRRNHEMPLR